MMVVGSTSTPLPSAKPEDRSRSASPRDDESDEARSILPTLNDDGSRRWLKPKPMPGRYMARRRIVAFGLIAIFALLPLVQLGGRPLVLLDIVYRRFYLFGATFYPTDTLLLALLLVGGFLTIFWITALLGRVWCGWACPQTVYMEFVYRPIERFFEGTPGRAKKGWLQTTGFGSILKYPVYLVISLALAHTFLAYFVSWSELRHWVFGSPLEHFAGFVTVLLITGAMMLDFSFLREQVCLVMCPYGRMQSVMLDRQSMVIRYDERRGEPRGRKAAKSVRSADLALPVLNAATAPAVGDCIDCHQCVVTCPTGIDIRCGLQMECIGCAQCIDACDAVMDKVGRARGLIRYSTQSVMEGAKFKLLRARVLLYPAVIAVIAVIFAVTLANTGIAEVTVLRGAGQPFVITPAGEVENNVRIKIINRLAKPAEFTLEIGGANGARLALEHHTVTVGPDEMRTIPAQIFAPLASFHEGHAHSTITVRGPEGFVRTMTFSLIGPVSREHDDHKPSQPKEHHDDAGKKEPHS